MTVVQYMEEILDSDWKPDASDVTGRNHDVDTPAFVRESSEIQRKVSSTEQDVIFLRDGGITTIEPRGFGWDHERLVSRVELDIRTTHSRERLWGHRDSDNDAETHGGLMGEAKRIVDAVRKGDKEFDLIRVEEQNDLSGQMGGLVWRGTMTVILDVRANTI